MKKKGNVTGYNIILLIVLSRKFKYEVWLHTATSYIVLDVEHGQRVDDRPRRHGAKVGALCTAVAGFSGCYRGWALCSCAPCTYTSLQRLAIALFHHRLSFYSQALSAKVTYVIDREQIAQCALYSSMKWASRANKHFLGAIWLLYGTEKRYHKEAERFGSIQSSKKLVGGRC